jgi:23S rRNA pseudoU1915 N3-methylase RlmH
MTDKEIRRSSIEQTLKSMDPNGHVAVLLVVGGSDGIEVVFSDENQLRCLGLLALAKQALITSNTQGSSPGKGFIH